jgi:hypothetical protein
VVVQFLAPGLPNTKYPPWDPKFDNENADPRADYHLAKGDCAAPHAPRRNATPCCAAGCHTISKTVESPSTCSLSDFPALGSATNASANRHRADERPNGARDPRDRAARW